MTKISQLSSIGDSLAIGDQFLIRDIDDTGSPNKSVTVSGITRALDLGTAAAPAIAFTTDKNTGIFSPGADQVAISTNGTGRLFVDATGNIGVGTASPTSFGAGAVMQSIAGTTGYGGYLGFTNNVAVQLWADEVGLAGYMGTRTNHPLIATTNNTERLRITSAGNVGIGTSSPNYELHVNASDATNFIQLTNSGTGTGVSDGFLFYNNGVNASISNQEAGYLSLETSGQARLHILSDGKVGIGSTGPVGKLSVETASATDPGTVVTAGWDSTYVLIGDSDNANGANLGLGFRTGGITSGFGTQIVSLDPNADWYPINYQGNLHVWYGGGTERARIDTSGRLLVGTSSFLNSNSKCELVGNNGGVITLANDNINISAANFVFGQINFYTADTSGSNTGIFAKITAESNRIFDADAASGMDLKFYAGNVGTGANTPTERMRIGSGGLIQTFATAGDAFVGATGSAAGTTLTLLGLNNAATNTQNGTTCFRIFTNGNTQNTNNSYTGISDVKLKENIVDANSQWDDLKDLQVRNYNFKQATGHQTHTQIGLIAQEVELVSPGLVTESPDRDAEGNDLGTVTKSVNYSVLYMKAVKALQEAMERIEALETSNTDLLARVIALETA